MIRLGRNANALFQWGLVVKLLAILLLIPIIQKNWFVPFVQQSLWPLSLDPWNQFLAKGGDAAAFPYGWVMLAVHAPFVAVGQCVDWLLGTSSRFSQIGFGLSLLAVDMALLWTLTKIVDAKHTLKLLWAYWCSPLVFFITYWHGQTDLVPVTLMVLALLSLKEKKLFWCGLCLGLSLSAKLSAAIVLPFILIVLMRNARYYPHWPEFAKGLLLPLVLLLVPTLAASGAWEMIFLSPQTNHLWDFRLFLDGNQTLYILPILYAGLLYAVWEIGRMNLTVITAFLGMAFFFLILFCHAPVGWTLWVVPFLALYQLQADTIKQILIAVFSGLFILAYTGQASGADWIGGALPPLSYSWPVINSCLVATGLLLAMNMMRNAFRNNRFNQLTRAPISIGIAGDSCTGKDTLSLALTGLFGEHRVAALSGDDYHRFERHHGLWQVMTHLNPKANYLHEFAKDATALLTGQTVSCRQYDHHTGRFHPSRPLSSADVLLFSGLHTLLDEPVRNALTVKVFLSMDESLRRHLKIKRDVDHRGHSPDKVLKNIEARTEDYHRYIAPQAAFADVHFHLSALHAQTHPKNFLLCATFQTRFDVDALARALMVCVGVPCQIEESPKGQQIRVTMSDVPSHSIEQLSQRLTPQLEALLATQPQWESNLIGLMQVIILMILDAKARGGQRLET